ncbi:hypothetical protein ACFVYG_27560 [Streptomyces sp. NPDC058256]|uniref:hypothetical protein n=1 Tax=Streptomyces sp. NPDC058256 TaxID=3346408 RepID=UPI0036EFE655
MPLPRLVLTDSQRHLLAELVLQPLPDPAEGDAGEVVILARGLDVSEVLRDVQELGFLGLVLREDGAVVATDLGAAIHYQALHEVAESRLTDVVRLAAAVEDDHPHLTRVVRQLVQGDVTLDQALASVDQKS